MQAGSKLCLIHKDVKPKYRALAYSQNSGSIEQLRTDSECNCNSCNSWHRCELPELKNRYYSLSAGLGGNRNSRNNRSMRFESRPKSKKNLKRQNFMGHKMRAYNVKLTCKATLIFKLAQKSMRGFHVTRTWCR